MKILVIEDEPELCQVICQSLEKEMHIVESANNYKTGLDKIISFDYDCILLDIMLPDGSGMDLLKNLKNEGKKDSVIIISAKDSLDDKIEGLDLGADDYLTKPFHLAELHARIKSVLRRNNHNGQSLIVWNNIKMSPENRTVEVNSSLLNLTKKEFDLLYYFLINPNRLISKTAIAEHVWGDYMDEASSLDFVYSQVKNLRKKLKDHEADINIQAVYGLGYKMI
ncbi:response regulator transcription factor [Apibacter raozihei]|uniref:response regulator transcription factor n=1 Tax=Apibacter TaxID=1778601 RepID=UPI000FE2EE66|nr:MULTISPECIES: response regulator transcription factor [Apibacter]